MRLRFRSPHWPIIIATTWFLRRWKVAIRGFQSAQKSCHYGKYKSMWWSKSETRIFQNALLNSFFGGFILRAHWTPDRFRSPHGPISIATARFLCRLKAVNVSFSCRYDNYRCTSWFKSKFFSSKIFTKIHSLAGSFFGLLDTWMIPASSLFPTKRSVTTETYIYPTKKILAPVGSQVLQFFVNAKFIFMWYYFFFRFYSA